MCALPTTITSLLTILSRIIFRADTDRLFIQPVIWLEGIRYCQRAIPLEGFPVCRTVYPAAFGGLHYLLVFLADTLEIVYLRFFVSHNRFRYRDLYEPPSSDDARCEIRVIFPRLPAFGEISLEPYGSPSPFLRIRLLCSVGFESTFSRNFITNNIWDHLRLASLFGAVFLQL
jgi:hypothetical protein